MSAACFTSGLRERRAFLGQRRSARLSRLIDEAGDSYLRAPLPLLSSETHLYNAFVSTDCQRALYRAKGKSYARQADKRMDRMKLSVVRRSANAGLFRIQAFLARNYHSREK